MGHITNDEFFVKLQELFDSRKGKDHGSVFLTQKRLSYDQALPETTNDSIFPDLHPPRPLPVLVRATNGKSKEKRKENKKLKLSTIVEAEAIPAFFDKYAEVCKAGMTTLKPRDRSKRKGKAKKKKGTGVGASAA
ncbi:signal recognition particle 14kD protein-domain-containing protein [Xylariales sp. PMI_506]|nr:signal recognition particle 14kD protein-domain-containing protein [Xylariales sp. PMI_506]